MRGLFFHVMTGNQDDLRFGRHPAQFIGRCQSIHYWHDEIHHHHVWLDLARAMHSGLAVLRFVNCPLGLLSQQRAQSPANEWLVIDYQDFGWYGHYEAEAPRDLPRR